MLPGDVGSAKSVGAHVIATMTIYIKTAHESSGRTRGRVNNGTILAEIREVLLHSAAGAPAAVEAFVLPVKLLATSVYRFLTTISFWHIRLQDG
jgi:hypothetical protein